MGTMEKQDYSQLDLFNKAGEAESSGSRLSGTFLSYIRTYERLVLMFIGIVITGVVCFCVGVEKGKRIALTQTNINLDIASRSTPVSPAANAPAAAAQPARTVPQPVKQPALAVPADQPVTSVKAMPQTVPQSAQQPAGAFTIQVATFSGKTTAVQEISDLKKQGLLPMLRQSGKYTILCVGSFPDQATARSLLTQLKRKYRDCYIRRL
jgi:hypothetical protein